jgi:hypothetical protein
VLGRRPEAGQSVLADAIGRRIDQRRDESQIAKVRNRADERVALEGARAALPVEIEVAAAAREQHDRDRLARGRRGRPRQSVAGRGAVVGRDRHDLPAIAC